MSSGQQSIAPAALSVARRRFIQSAFAGVGLLGLSRLGLAADAPAEAVAAAAASDIPPTQGLKATASAARDQDILNFALNLEYLEAEFYLRAVTGQGLEVYADTGSDVGPVGTVTGGRQVTFTTPVVRDLAAELANDELNHVRFLRKATKKTIARPAIDLAGSFTAAALAAGLIQPGQTFDAFADETNFLLASFIFEDVGVTAYLGAAPLIKNKAILEAAAGILAVEAYHAGAIRTLLFERGLGAQSKAISDLRDSVDGSPDTDQPVIPDGGFTAVGPTNIVPALPDGTAPARTPGQVLAIAYLSPTAEAGGFFPNGVNGVIR
jgi:hypothetical protein